jgi:hypothetical protein
MKKALTIMLIAILAVSFAMAQDVGLRGGIRSGLTGRFELSEETKAEILLAVNGGVILTGMYQWHKPLSIGEIENFSWYYGGGVHVGLGWSASWSNSFGVGVDGIIGAEYDFESLINLPISLSLDWKPGIDFLNFSDSFDAWSSPVKFWDSAFSIRYSF